MKKQTVQLWTRSFTLVTIATALGAAGGRPPQPCYLEPLRRRGDEVWALRVFDETVDELSALLL